ncbi:MAG: dienelactone hydrolase, partial [Pirellulales bacterium]
MAYDPLVALYTDTHEFRLDVSTEDPDRQVPILLSLPDTKQPVPIILFSHGLGGSREGNSYLRKQ